MLQLVEQPFGKCSYWTTTIIYFGDLLELTSFNIKHAIQMRRILDFNHQNSPLCLIIQLIIGMHIYFHKSDQQQ